MLDRYIREGPDLKKVIMSSTPGLGLLASLPAELRLEIWKHLPLDRDEIGHGDKPPRQKLAILYTSRQINHEASAVVYANIDLEFFIDPRYSRKSWLRVKTNLGTDYALQDINDAEQLGFSKLPYEKLRRIHFDIEAPNRRDPAQVVCLYNKCTSLVTLLQSATHGLPDLTLRLSDSAVAKWTVDGAPQKSVAWDRPRNTPIVDEILDRADHEAYIFDDDSKLVLVAFVRLREARSAHIFIPDDMEREERFLARLESLWTDEGLFGTYLDPEYSWNDTALQERMDITFTDLDLELDMLPGATADMLRLDRFSAWYTDEAGGESPYEKEYERIIKSWPHGKDFRDEKVEKLNWRYGIMRALNPRSFYYQYTKPRVLASGIYLSIPDNDASKKKQLVESGLVSNVWDREAWYEEYGNGVPVLRSKYKWSLLEIFSRVDGDVLPKCDYDMKEKLGAWVGVDADSQKNVSGALGERSTEVSNSESSESKEDEDEDEEDKEDTGSSDSEDDDSEDSDSEDSSSDDDEECTCMCKCMRGRTERILGMLKRNKSF